MTLTRKDVEEMTGPQLVEQYNRITKGRKVNKFSDHATGVKRVLAAMEEGGGERPSRKSDEPLNLHGLPEIRGPRRFRRGTRSAKALELLASSGGNAEQLAKLLSVKQGQVRSILRQFNRRYGIPITEDVNGVFRTDELPTDHLPIDYTPSIEPKEFRPGSKRERIHKMISRTNGATADEIADEMGWASKPALVRESLRLICSRNGRTIKEDEKGRIRALN